MARKPKEQRKAEQLVRQKALRASQKQKRRPDRDDFARVLLWLLTSKQMPGCGTDIEIARVRDDLIGHLVDQGFDEREADEVWDTLLFRYGTVDNPFRRKLHLEMIEPHPKP